MTPETPFLPFETIFNFRDYGGYATRSGATVRRGALYRSGQHADATAADLDRVGALNLATVIDLRGESEQTSHPCQRPAGFAARVLRAEGETARDDGIAPHLAVPSHAMTAEEAHGRMVRLYAALPFRPAFVSILQRYFVALADAQGPSLLHCMAGKDRTGIAAALLHNLLGVHDDDAMADYLLTNQAPRSAERISARMRATRDIFGVEMSEAAIATTMSVDPAYLGSALSAITARHGSVSAYAEAVLAVDPHCQTALEAALLA